MIVRIRLGARPRLQRKRRHHQVARALAALINPAAVMALALAMWRLAADLKFAGEFPIPVGLFSHWQIWLVTGAGLKFCSISLNRNGTLDEPYQETVETSDCKLANSES